MWAPQPKVVPLSARMAQHRKDLIRHSNYKIYKLMAGVGVEHFYIELIKSFPCNNREELEAEEGRHMRLHNTLAEDGGNMLMAGRGIKQYNIDNRDKIRATQKAYNEVHKDSKREYNTAYYEANKNGIADVNKEYYDANKARILEAKKVYYKDHVVEHAAKHRAYVEAHKAELAEKGIAYRAANKNMKKAYDDAHKEAKKEKDKARYELKKAERLAAANA